MSITDIDSTERRIIKPIVKRALEAGFVVSVHDGEEFALKRSTKTADIYGVIGDTDETHLAFRMPEGPTGGWVQLIHGNGEDVVSDYSDNPATRKIVDDA